MNKNKELLYEPVFLLKATQLSGCVVYCYFFCVFMFFISKMVTMVFQTWVMNGKATQLHSETWMALEHSTINQQQWLCQRRNGRRHWQLLKWHRQWKKKKEKKGKREGGRWEKSQTFAHPLTISLNPHHYYCFPRKHSVLMARQTNNFDKWQTHLIPV